MNRDKKIAHFSKEELIPIALGMVIGAGLIGPHLGEDQLSRRTGPFKYDWNCNDIPDSVYVIKGDTLPYKIDGVPVADILKGYPK